MQCWSLKCLKQSSKVLAVCWNGCETLVTKVKQMISKFCCDEHSRFSFSPYPERDNCIKTIYSTYGILQQCVYLSNWITSLSVLYCSIRPGRGGASSVIRQYTTNDKLSAQPDRLTVVMLHVLYTLNDDIYTTTSNKTIRQGSFILKIMLLFSVICAYKLRNQWSLQMTYIVLLRPLCWKVPIM